MATLRLEQVTKVFDRSVRAVDSVSFSVDHEEFAVLLGPSGCGKTTILRLIAGLEQATSGSIFIDDDRVDEYPPHRRDIAMVFQNYALYPHMTVFDNLAFGLRMRRENKNEVNRRVKEAAEILEIADLLKRKPRQLSGGQRQRVALGRAMVRKPKLFLFDEPLSNLDAKLRVQMRAELARLHQRLRATIVYVTHDQIEAMTLGQKIVVLKQGVIQQISDPLDLYRKPANRFVAGFIGSPPMNFLRGSIRRTGQQVEFAGQGIVLRLNEAFARHLGQDIILGIRPADFTLDPHAHLNILVDVIEPIGSEVYVYGRSGDATLQIQIPEDRKPRIGDHLAVGVVPGRICVFDGKTEQAIA